MPRAERVIVYLSDGTVLDEQVDGNFQVFNTFEPTYRGHGTTTAKWGQKHEVCQVTWTKVKEPQ